MALNQITKIVAKTNKTFWLQNYFLKKRKVGIHKKKVSTVSITLLIFITIERRIFVIIKRSHLIIIITNATASRTVHIFGTGWTHC